MDSSNDHGKKEVGVKGEARMSSLEEKKKMDPGVDRVKLREQLI